VFIGLITHSGTQYPESSAPQGLARSLGEDLAGRGLEVEVEVFAQDLWTPEILDTTPAVVRRSINAELEVEARWRVFHAASSLTPAARLILRLRKWNRLRRYIGLGHSARNLRRGHMMIKRLVNIELAHLHLMQRAIDSGAGWALIIEDDAHGETRTIADTLISLLSFGSQSEQPKFVNLSRSFTEERLGISAGLTPLQIQRDSGEAMGFLSARKPVTNTVCAVLYRTDFLRSLMRHFARIPLDPVIPIDWKLNAALMEMYAAGDVVDGDSWLCQEAPIVQGSMHSE